MAILGRLASWCRQVSRDNLPSKMSKADVYVRSRIGKMGSKQSFAATANSGDFLRIQTGSCGACIQRAPQVFRS
jgi:hypothetical protein